LSQIPPREHRRRAVDLTLYETDGQGGADADVYDEMSPRARADYAAGSATAS
jgi:D-alanyl-D-alanine dipeptidase